MSKNGLMSIHANMHEQDGYWVLRITADKVDAHGSGEVTVAVRDSAEMPKMDTDLDQVWVALVTLIHLIEKEGSLGRISSRVDAPLF